jgi:hypothetical protein
MKSSLDGLIAYIESTADSDQSGDYDSMRVGEKRSFKDFITAEFDDSDQPKAFANDLLDEIGSTKGCCGALRHSSASDRSLPFCVLFFSAYYSFSFIDSAILAGCCVFITERLMFFAYRGFLYLRFHINALLQSFNNHMKVFVRVAREPL